MLFDTVNATTKINSRYKGAGLNACGRVQQRQNPDLWGSVYNEETQPVFIGSAPSKKKIGIIIKAGGNDNLSIDFPINVPTLRTVAGFHVPHLAA